MRRLCEQTNLLWAGKFGRGVFPAPTPRSPALRSCGAVTLPLNASDLTKSQSHCTGPRTRSVCLVNSTYNAFRRLKRSTVFKGTTCTCPLKPESPRSAVEARSNVPTRPCLENSSNRLPMQVWMRETKGEEKERGKGPEVSNREKYIQYSVKDRMQTETRDRSRFMTDPFPKMC